MSAKLTVADYPVAEKRPELVKGRGGKPLAAITLDAVVAGEVNLDDLRITPEALLRQAEIARDAGRATLAANFERAAELCDVPQDFIMRVYELLRPGRARDKAPLLDAAKTLRETYGATRMAAFVEEAAAVYERRGLFTYRF
ncbi:MAG TPA: diol dehydratase small subunit [Kofleriaceae bacterium]|jgi:propanediol dehydratase small subunit